MLRGLTALVLTLLGMSAAWAQASVQAWPSKQPIRVVVPIAAGSGTDLTARLVFEQVSNQIGQAIVVENRVGADGRMGVEYVSRQAPDGYTFLTIGTANAAHASLFRNLPLATLYAAISADAARVAGREAQIERALDYWYRGPVAEAIAAGLEPPAPRAFGDPWRSEKDGKQWFDLRRHANLMRK